MRSLIDSSKQIDRPRFSPARKGIRGTIMNQAKQSRDEMYPLAVSAFLSKAGFV